MRMMYIQHFRSSWGILDDATAFSRLPLGELEGWRIQRVITHISSCTLHARVHGAFSSRGAALVVRV